MPSRHRQEDYYSVSYFTEFALQYYIHLLVCSYNLLGMIDTTRV